MGCTPHSWRVAEARLRGIGTNRVTLDTTGAETARPREALATYLRSHREAIAAMDFFTVPTLTFGILYCFFILSHDRRRIVHHNVTRNPVGSKN